MYAEKKLKGTKKRTIIGEITSPNFKTQEATEVKTVMLAKGQTQADGASKESRNKVAQILLTDLTKKQR